MKNRRSTLGNTKAWHTINGRRQYVTLAEATLLKKQEHSLTDREKSLEVYNSSKETSVGTQKEERNGHTVYKEIYSENRKMARLSIRATLTRDWGHMLDSSNEVVLIQDVKYVPEGTFKAHEIRGNNKSRMLVAAMSVETGTMFQVNIADEIHSLIGNCSQFRAKKLTENKPEKLRLEGDCFRMGDLKKWFERAGLPFKA